MTETPEREFEMQIEIQASRDAVWNAIAHDTEIRRWFAPKARTSGEVGGEIVWEWNAHHRWPQRIEILEPGKRLRTRYDSGVDDGVGGKKPLYVDWLLEGEGGMTTLRLVQSGFGPEAGFDQEYDGISRGWPVELRSLRLYLENHAGQDRGMAWSTMDLEVAPAEAWKKLTSAEGLACGEQVQALKEGEPFQFVTCDGDVFSGKALQCHEREFSGEALSHGRAFLRATVYEWDGQAHVWCWLGVYGEARAELPALQERWDAMLQGLFVENGEPVSGAKS